MNGFVIVIIVIIITLVITLPLITPDTIPPLESYLAGQDKWARNPRGLLSCIILLEFSSGMVRALLNNPTPLPLSFPLSLPILCHISPTFTDILLHLIEGEVQEAEKHLMLGTAASAKALGGLLASTTTPTTSPGSIILPSVLQ